MHFWVGVGKECFFRLVRQIFRKKLRKLTKKKAVVRKKKFPSRTKFIYSIFCIYEKCDSTILYVKNSELHEEIVNKTFNGRSFNWIQKKRSTYALNFTFECVLSMESMTIGISYILKSSEGLKSGFSVSIGCRQVTPKSKVPNQLSTLGFLGISDVIMLYVKVCWSHNCIFEEFLKSLRGLIKLIHTFWDLLSLFKKSPFIKPLHTFFLLGGP